MDAPLPLTSQIQNKVIATADAGAAAGGRHTMGSKGKMFKKWIVFLKVLDMQAHFHFKKLTLQKRTLSYSGFQAFQVCFMIWLCSEIGITGTKSLSKALIPLSINLWPETFI